MCQESATADDVRAAMPHPVVGSAADPIALELGLDGGNVATLTWAPGNCGRTLGTWTVPAR